MKKYIGSRVPTGTTVKVVDAGSMQELPLRLDIRNHSPTGFEWGYGGSGPAQLALAILADHMGPKKAPEACPHCGSKMNPMGDDSLYAWRCSNEEECGFDGLMTGEAWERVVSLYQHFKCDFVARWSQREGFMLEEHQIKDWLDERNAQEAK